MDIGLGPEKPLVMWNVDNFQISDFLVMLVARKWTRLTHKFAKILLNDTGYLFEHQFWCVCVFGREKPVKVSNFPNFKISDYFMMPLVP